MNQWVYAVFCPWSDSNVQGSCLKSSKGFVHIFCDDNSTPTHNAQYGKAKSAKSVIASTGWKWKKKKIKRTLFNHTKNADKLSRAINLDEKWHRPTSGGSGARRGARHGARVKAHRDVLGGRCGINKLSEARKAKESNSSKLKQDLMSEICLFPQSKAKSRKKRKTTSQGRLQTSCLKRHWRPLDFLWNSGTFCTIWSLNTETWYWLYLTKVKRKSVSKMDIKQILSYIYMYRYMHYAICMTPKLAILKNTSSFVS